MRRASCPKAPSRSRTRGSFPRSCANSPRPSDCAESGSLRRRLRAFELRPIHLEQLFDGRRVLGSLVISPAARESRESDGESGPRSNGFFFQAEDGIRDLTVTGVQTCALPI